MYNSKSNGWIGSILAVFVVGLLLTGLSACKQQTLKPQPLERAQQQLSSETPAWVTNNISTSTVEYGVGAATIYGGNEADAINRARENARLELLKNFRAQVKGSTNYRELAQNDVIVSSELRNTVQVLVPKVEIEGIRIEDVFVDHGKHSVYALASLNKQEGARRIREQISNIDSQLETSARKLKLSSNRIKAIRQAYPDLEQMLQRDQYAANYQLMGFNQKQISQSAIIDRYQKQVFELIADLGVYVESGGREKTLYADKLKSRLTSAGFDISSSRNADLVLENSIRTQNSQEGDYVFCSASVTTRMKDQSGRSLKTWEKKSKGIAGDKRSACDKAIRKAGDSVGKDLATNLLKYIGH